MIESVTKQIVELGLNMIVEGLRYYDELLRINKDMRKYWYIVKKDETTLISRLGSIKYHKTLFINKVTNERSSAKTPNSRLIFSSEANKYTT